MGAFVQKKKFVFYELPERGLQIEKYMTEKKDVECLWDGLKFNLKNETVTNSEEIKNRVEELQIRIDNLEKLAKSVNQTKSDALYLKNLKKRKELTDYVIYLCNNGGVDENYILEKDFEEPRSQNLEKLMIDQRFWRNLGRYYNQNFDNGIDYESKVTQLEIEIEKRNKELDEMEEEENRQQRMREEKRQEEMIRKREEEFEEVHYQEESNYREESQEDIVMSIEKRGREEFDRKEREEQERVERLEKENMELEISIRQLENQKKKMEVR